MGRCNFSSVQAGTAVTFAGAQTSIATGNVGVAPNTAITGDVAFGTGTRESNTVYASNCAADELIAYDILKNLTCTPNNTLTNSDLSGVTLTTGIYCSSAGTFTMTGAALTLDGNGDDGSQFIFQTSTTVITAATTSFVLINGAHAKNVYWQVGSSATLGLGSFFVGHVLAHVSISVGSSTHIVGRLLAQAAVTFDGAGSVTLP